MPDMIQTKLFRTGGSVAIRIPAGWLDPHLPVTLQRDPHTGRVYVSQGTEFDTQDFFEFLSGKEFLEDPGFEALERRAEGPREIEWRENSLQ